jgi:hypothetical protein
MSHGERLVSFYREAISHEIMALVENQYMGSSLEMRILKGNTLDLARCPWQILGPTQMALNFISQLCPAHGLMEDMLFLDRSAFLSTPSNQSVVCSIYILNALHASCHELP